MSARGIRSRKGAARRLTASCAGYPSRFVSGRTVALHFRLPHCEHRRRRTTAVSSASPSREPRECLRLRSPAVAASAGENQNVLPEMIGESDDDKGLARRHHPPIVASRSAARPSSTGAPQTLYANGERTWRDSVVCACLSKDRGLHDTGCVESRQRGTLRSPRETKTAPPLRELNF
jgi:hypothetical protein